MICLVDGEGAEPTFCGGRLCRKCAGSVTPCDGLIPEHVRSTVTMTDAEAWLVDGFGSPHAVAPKTTIGRHSGEILVLASSVSREHAELRQVDGGWQVRDLGSRNGTFLDGVRVQGRVPLPPRAVLKVGDVALWFLSEPAQEPEQPLSMATGAAGDGLVRYTIVHRETEMCVVGATGAGGGALLSRNAGATEWGPNRDLPPLEFQLLRTLCASAYAEADSPAAARGCVATKLLARDLPFQSKYANEENVRQVVRRLRTALGELGADGILAVVPGRGYYLACEVTVAGADRR